MGKFHICTQILQRKNVVFRKNLHSWKYFYTTAGRDGRDKFQVCLDDTFSCRGFAEMADYEVIPRRTAVRMGPLPPGIVAMVDSWRVSFP